MNQFWNDYPEIKDDMENVEAILRKNMRCKEKIVEDMLLELLDSGGKMLRPAFTIISANFGDFNAKNIYSLAAVIEMLHMATLIHDDIIDNSEFRRGKKTAQAKYGQGYAVFMGDYLFTRCFMLLSDDTSLENMKKISMVISRICLGEIEQFSSHYMAECTLRQYIRRISAKTAALFALSFYIGAAESSCPQKMCNNLARIGYYIGMAFQVIDDILDYDGSEEIVGKPLGNDIKQGIFTAPLIYAARTKNPELLELISKKDYTKEETERIIERVKACGGTEKAGTLAKKYTDKAFKYIDKLYECESKTILKDVTRKLLQRTV